MLRFVRPTFLLRWLAAILPRTGPAMPTATVRTNWRTAILGKPRDGT